MEQEISQEQMNPEEMQKDLGDTKASLAFSNMLREQRFMEDNPPMEGEEEQDGTESLETAPETMETEEPMLDEESSQEVSETDLKGEMESVKSEIKDSVKAEIADLRKELIDTIKDALEYEE